MIGRTVMAGAEVETGACVRFFFIERASTSLYLGWPASVDLKDLRASRSRLVAGVLAVDSVGKLVGGF